MRAECAKTTHLSLSPALRFDMVYRLRLTALSKETLIVTTFGPRSTHASSPARLVLAGGLLIVLSAVAALLLVWTNHDALRRPIGFEEPQERFTPTLLLPLPQQNLLKPL